MIYETQFELPHTFLHHAHELEHASSTKQIEVKLTIPSSRLLHQVAEQTGLTERGVASALLNESLARIHKKGVRT